MRRFLLALIVALAAGSSATCGGTSQSVTAPSTVKCPVTASANPTSFGADGGSGSLSVSTNRECQWSATATGAWIQLSGSTSGQGDATVSFSIASNPDPSERRGAIAVGDQQVAIAQQARACTFGVSPIAESIPSKGGRRTLTVTASAAACPWTARASAAWLVIVEGSEGNGSGRVVYEARETNGPSRTGTLIVAGHTITVTQGQGCSTAIAPETEVIGASGGSGTIAVSTAAGCPWTADTDVPWLTITSARSGSGPGEVSFSAAAWDGPTRTGTIHVDEHVFTVTQTAGCSYTLQPASQSLPAGGGSGDVAVHTAAGCPWTAAANAAWLTITAGATGSGEGHVRFTALATSGPARSGTLTIAGRTFKVEQDSGCAYSLSATSGSVPPGGGSGSVAVTTGGGCSWTAATSSAWVHITAGASGSGSGTVGYAADANDGDARSATLTIAGVAYTLAQEGACVFSIDPTSQLVDSGGGSGSFTLTTGAACAWTAAASDAWVRITSGGGGTGSGTVAFSVDANGGPARTGAIVAGGRTFTVDQNSGCSVSISPASQSFGADEGTGTIGVTAGAGCAWSASVTSGAEWISIVSGSGSGDGSVQFSVAANTGAARSGTIAVGGQTFTVTQAGV